MRLYLSFYSQDSDTNLRTKTALDPVIKIPELKVRAVMLENVTSFESTVRDV